MSDATKILEAMQRGDAKAAAELLPLVYDELRRLAAGQIAREAAGHTLNATALVHEAYLRLVGDQQFEHRGHFYVAAAEAMRRVLIDHSRRKKAKKRGKGLTRMRLDDLLKLEANSEHLLAVDDALTRFAKSEPKKAELVKLRFFTGMTTQEAADNLGVSLSTAERWWTYARAWLFAELSDKKKICGFVRGD